MFRLPDSTGNDVINTAQFLNHLAFAFPIDYFARVEEQKPLVFFDHLNKFTCFILQRLPSAKNEDKHIYNGAVEELLLLWKQFCTSFVYGYFLMLVDMASPKPLPPFISQCGGIIFKAYLTARIQASINVANSEDIEDDDVGPTDRVCWCGTRLVIFAGESRRTA